MATRKPEPRYLVTVTEAGHPAVLFSRASARAFGEAGTVAWMLAGRAWLHGDEQPEVQLYKGDELELTTRPSRDFCMNPFNRGAHFWAHNIIEEIEK